MMTSPFGRLFALALLVVSAGCAARPPAEPLRVAVAANFQVPAEEIVRSFEQATGHDVEMSAGSTGALYAQITHGAPFDVFLAADQERPRRLEHEATAVAGSRFTYALGRLALWSPRPGFVDDAVPRISLATSLELRRHRVLEITRLLHDVVRHQLVAPLR